MNETELGMGYRCNYVLAVSQELDVLNPYFDKEVEILGKLVEKAVGTGYTRVELLPGRIRMAKPSSSKIADS